MATYAVNVHRYTDQPRLLIEFFQALGLRRRADVEGDGLALMKAGDGWVTVRAVEPGEGVPGVGDAQLTFLTRSVDAALEELSEGGLNPRVHVDAIGRHAIVSGPAGSDVIVDEHEVDLYGSRAHAEPVASPLVVTAVTYSGDFARDEAFFGRFGLSVVGERSEHWTALDGQRGRIGLHAPSEGSAEVTAGPLLVDLAFETTEPLADVARRLQQAGFDDARVVEHSHLTAVHVAAPDGRELEIHRLSR